MTTATKKLSPEEPGKLKQLSAAIIVNIAVLTYGMNLGWSSPTSPTLMSNNTPVGSTPMSSDEISWLNGTLCLGALSALPLCSKLSEKFGRKKFGCLIAIPLISCWFIKLIAFNYYCLLISQYLGGIGGAMSFFLIPIYVSEISADSIRGQLGTFLIFAVNIGIVLGYTIGAHLSYRLFAAFSMIPPITFFFGFIFMPETPIYLVRNNRIADATRSLMWLKNNDTSTVEHELQHLNKLANENSDKKSKIGFKDLFRDRGTTKGFIIALGLMIGQQLCGISAIAMYTSEIFKLAGSSMSPNSSAIIFGSIQVIGSFLSTIMMEKAGRRSLILVSCFGMALCHFILGAFLSLMTIGYEVESFSWIPIVAMSFYAVTYCLGMGPAPFVVASEVFASDISSFANSVSMFTLWLFAFLTIKFFPIVISAIGMAGCFYLFSLFCTFTFFFTIFIVPETKGKPIELIFAELNGCPDKLDRGYTHTCLEINDRKNSKSSNV